MSPRHLRLLRRVSHHEGNAIAHVPDSVGGQYHAIGLDARRPSAKRAHDAARGATVSGDRRSQHGQHAADSLARRVNADDATWRERAQDDAIAWLSSRMSSV